MEARKLFNREHSIKAKRVRDLMERSDWWDDVVTVPMHMKAECSLEQVTITKGHVAYLRDHFFFDDFVVRFRLSASYQCIL